MLAHSCEVGILSSLFYVCSNSIFLLQVGHIHEVGHVQIEAGQNTTEVAAISFVHICFEHNSCLFQLRYF